VNLSAGNQPLLLNDLPAMHWGLAGAGIALITLLLLWTTNRRLGISTSFESVCAVASDLPYFRRSTLHGPGRWRLYFLGGLLMGGVLSAVLGGGWAPTWELGLWDASVGTVLGATPLVKSLWMFGGGMLIGLGTRISNGCTSGHGIFGLSNLEWGSLKAVLAFMATGMITANLIHGILF
jgi:uncharacterized membrane protein YedE/YeeE